MATNPFKQTPAIPSTTQSSNTQHYYDEPTTHSVLSSITTGGTPGTTSGSGSSAADNSTNILKQRAPCACSNISIMQLFHEMKQKYPTVPDTVVSELVTQNCHDRPACIGKLEEAVLGTPGQTTYPSQSIHSGSLKRRSGERKQVGNRSDGSNSYSSNSSSNSSRESSVDSSRLQGTACPSTHQQQQGAPVAANVGYSDSRLIGESRISGTCANRPTTLAVRPTNTGTGYFGGAPPAPPMRPNRTAPACPPSNGPLATSTITTTTTASSSAEHGETVNLQVNVTVSPKAVGPLIAGQRHTSTISLQPEPPYSRELAQVSSTFSGGNQLPTAAAAGTPGGSSRTSSSGGMGGCTNNANGGRSSTSVNLTLRQPTDGRPRTPIHIHASPLKYTAKNFNAQSGIQSKLEVTFRDGFGSFSAMRAQVPGYEPQQEMTTAHYQEREPCAVALPDGHSGWYQSSPSVGNRVPYQLTGFPPPLASSSPLPNVAPHPMVPSRGINGQPLFADGQLESDGLTKEIRYQNFVVAEMAVSQQLEQKQRLSLEVERKRTQFESICREIFVLQQPLQFIDAQLLDREVLVLAAEVEQLQKEVDSCDEYEEARAQAAAAATAVGASITDGLSALSVEGGSPLMLPTSMVSGTGGTVVNRPPRPPRPPPPRAPTQSPSRGSSGSITPNTPLLAPSLAAFGGTSPAPTPSPSSSSTCSTSSSFVSNGGGDPMAASRLQPSAAGPNQPWTCSLCTFQNHELMPACEVCSLPKASGSRTAAAAAPTNNNNNNNPAFMVAGDMSDGGGGHHAAGALLRRQHHLSVDTGVAAAAAATAAVVGASVAGPSTAPPYPGVAEMPPPSFASLTGHSSTVMPLQTVPSHGQQQILTNQQQQHQQQQQQQQQQTQSIQQQTQQSNPPPLQNAQYQKSSIEC